MSASENESLVRNLVTAFTHGDLATIAASLSPDAVWDFPGSSIVNGTYKGPEEIVGFLAKSFELSGGTLSVELLDLTASASGATQVQRIGADHGGRSFSGIELIHHQIEDGRIVATYHRSDDPAIAGFFGSA